ncbi:hypothetical protein AVEN_34526-1, partial [Araneus ventricosus]
MTTSATSLEKGVCHKFAVTNSATSFALQAC